MFAKIHLRALRAIRRRACFLTMWVLEVSSCHSLTGRRLLEPKCVEETLGERLNSSHPVVVAAACPADSSGLPHHLKNPAFAGFSLTESALRNIG